MWNEVTAQTCIILVKCLENTIIMFFAATSLPLRGLYSYPFWEGIGFKILLKGTYEDECV